MVRSDPDCSEERTPTKPASHFSGWEFEKQKSFWPAFSLCFEVRFNFWGMVILVIATILGSKRLPCSLYLVFDLR